MNLDHALHREIRNIIFSGKKVTALTTVDIEIIISTRNFVLC